MNDKIKYAKNEGSSQRQVAKLVGISLKTVRKFIRKLRIEFNIKKEEIPADVLHRFCTFKFIEDESF